MVKFNKFQCHHCGGVVMSEYDDDMVMCGHCEGTCELPTELGAGVVIDDFLIERFLGKGGMGNVFIAHQFTLDRQVALKILHPQFSEDPKFQVDFINEARSAASLNHINIIQAYKVGVDQGVLYFAMELVDGKDLSNILERENSLIEAYAIDIGIDMANALGYAWDKSKLVHNDIKPENIMVASDGTCKLMDLGLSQRAGIEADENDDTIAGTPQYISPEQILGTEVDIRSDFYSLGATLFHIVCGRFVFEAHDIQEMVKMHLSEPVPSLTQLQPAITPKFNKIVQKLLAKKPEDRYQKAADLLQDLEDLRDNAGRKPRKKAKKTISRNRQTARHTRKNPKVAKAIQQKKTSPVLMGLTIVIIVIAIAGGVYYSL